MDTNKLIKIVTSNPILEACREIDVNPTDLIKFYNNLDRLLKKDIPYGEIGERFTFLLVLTKGEKEIETELNIFETNVFVEEIKKGLFDKSNVLFVNSNGMVVTKFGDQFLNDYVQAAKLSQEHGKIVLFIQYMELHFFANGKPIYYDPNILQSERIGITTPKTLPAREYRQLILNQYSEMVSKQRCLQYWANKARRLLKSRPEIYFHKPLWWYLNEYVVDGKVDSGASISGTEDRTDIRILTFESREVYIIEIKCLGRTESGTYLSDDWANQGLIQINLYLKGESDSTRGTLVLYDGREKDEDIAWCTKIDCSPKYDNDPMRFYLESESASVKSKKIYGNLKKRLRSG